MKEESNKMLLLCFLQQLLSNVRYKKATFDLLGATFNQLVEKLLATVMRNLEQLVESPIFKSPFILTNWSLIRKLVF